MKTPEELRAERDKLFSDYFHNVTPERMPVMMTIPVMLLAQRNNVSPLDFQFDYGLLGPYMDELADLIYSDSCPINPIGQTARPPLYYALLGSQSFQMSDAGFVQHPEVVGMLDTEYDELIADPLKCVMDHILPRQYANLNFREDPYRALFAFQMGDMSNATDGGALMPFLGKLKARKGYFGGAPMGSGGFTAAPFDFLADQLRSFSGISADVRRKKTQIKEACEALLPYMFNVGLPKKPHPVGAVGMPLHMPPFMRTKDVEELWFPTYKKLLEQYAARGVRTSPFVESDWTRFLDMLYDLPAGTNMKFEGGDPKQIKEKLGDKMLLGGFYPLMLIRSGTPEQCVDKAKELLDIMLPGCGYILNTDKVPMNMGDVNLENYRAVSEYLRDNARFEHPGESFGTPLNSENYEIDEHIGDIHSEVLDDLFGHVTVKSSNPNVARREETYAKDFTSKIMKMFL